MNILFVGAHPDDIEGYAGGTAASAGRRFLGGRRLVLRGDGKRTYDNQVQNARRDCMERTGLKSL